MKRILFVLLLAAAAALTACHKQVLNEPSYNSDGSYTFSVKATAAETRSDYDADGKFSWSAGDAISVLFNNGTDDKFFTLTTTGSGASATFTGTIDAGYTIGSSADGTKWALYPASDKHTFGDVESGKFRFYYPSETDFTAEGAHWSANLPLYAQGDENNIFAFKNLDGGFKITVKELDESVSKIKVEIDNNAKTYKLNGEIPVKLDGSNYYLDHGWGNEGESRKLTYICNVASNTATVYVPVQPWRNFFQPTITITNPENGRTLKSVTASKTAAQLTKRGQVQPITIAAPGTGVSTEIDDPTGGLVAIDGDLSDWATIKGTVNEGEVIAEVKGYADDDNIYVYVKRTTHRLADMLSGGYCYYCFDMDNVETTGNYTKESIQCENYTYLYPYGGTTDAPIIIESPSGSSEGGIAYKTVKCAGMYTDDYIETEVMFPKTAFSVQPTGDKIAVTVWTNKDGGPKTRHEFSLSDVETIEIPEIPADQLITDGCTVLATNPNVEKFLSEVTYPDWNQEQTHNSLVLNYEGGYNGTTLAENQSIDPVSDKPCEYYIQWTANASAGKLTLHLAESTWSSDTEISAGADKAMINNLVPNTTYTYKVTAANGTVMTEGSFNTIGHLRQVFFQNGTRNGRDLGGWAGLNGKTVKYHKIFRGGRMYSSTLSSSGKKEVVAEGIGAQLDLRGSDRLSAPAVDGFDFCAPGVFQGGTTMLKDEKAATKTCFEFVVSSLKKNKGVYFHCSLGRDRTGTFTVLLLGLLGVREGDISKEYEVTYFAPMGYSVSSSEVGEGKSNPTGVFSNTRDKWIYADVAPYFWSLSTDGTFANGVENYLLNVAGVSQKDIDDFRSMMLE